MKVKELIEILKEVPEDASFDLVVDDEANEIEYFVNGYLVNITISDENLFYLHVYVKTPEMWKSINNTQYNTDIDCNSIKQCKEKINELIKSYDKIIYP
jgi:predicted choloylglycine hydrolase